MDKLIDVIPSKVEIISNRSSATILSDRPQSCFELKTLYKNVELKIALNSFDNKWQLWQTDFTVSTKLNSKFNFYVERKMNFFDSLFYQRDFNINFLTKMTFDLDNGSYTNMHNVYYDNPIATKLIHYDEFKTLANLIGVNNIRVQDDELILDLSAKTKFLKANTKEFIIYLNYFVSLASRFV